MINFVFWSPVSQRPNTQHTLPLKRNGGAPASEGTGFWEGCLRPCTAQREEEAGKEGRHGGQAGLQGCGELGPQRRIWSGLLALERMKDWKPVEAAGNSGTWEGTARFWIESGIPCLSMDWAPTESPAL